MPGMPRQSGWSSGNAPRAISVVTTWMSRELGQLAQRLGGPGLEDAATGVDHRRRSAAMISSAACWIGCGIADRASAGSRAAPVVHVLVRRPVPVHAPTPGWSGRRCPWGCRRAPGRAGRWWPGGTPRGSISGMSAASVTRKLCFVTDWVMPVMSHSWKASVPIAAERHLAGDAHHRHRVHVGVGQRRDDVRGRRDRSSPWRRRAGRWRGRSPRPCGRRPARGARGCGGSASR